MTNRQSALQRSSELAGSPEKSGRGDRPWEAARGKADAIGVDEAGATRCLTFCPAAPVVAAPGR